MEELSSRFESTDQVHTNTHARVRSGHNCAVRRSDPCIGRARLDRSITRGRINRKHNMGWKWAIEPLLFLVLGFVLLRPSTTEHSMALQA